MCSIFQFVVSRITLFTATLCVLRHGTDASWKSAAQQVESEQDDG